MYLISVFLQPVRYGGTKLERARDMFEHALSQTPPEHAKAIYLQVFMGLRDLNHAKAIYLKMLR